MYQQEEKFFQSHDGVNLYYQHWYRARGKNKQAIVMFHRGHEHSQRMEHIVQELGLDDYDFFAWDARGHGKSPGQRGYAPNVAHVVKDIDTFIAHISQNYGFSAENIIVLGQSVGAVTLSTWLHDYAPKVRGAILASPAFEVKLYVPLAIPGLKLLKKISSTEKYVSSYVKGEFLSHDPLRIEQYNHDVSITRSISVGMLIDLFETSKRVVADAYAIETPTLMLISGNDFVVQKEPQYAFFARLASEQKELYELPDFYHDTLGEKKRDIAYTYIRQFIRKLEQKVSTRDLTQTNPHHFSYIELEKLNRPSHRYEEKLFSLQRKALHFAAQFSDAIKIGEQTGFDSGSMLDYIYENEATSDNALGKIIDKAYLNAIGWRGIRVRKEHLEKAFLEVAKHVPEVRFVDIAAGHGRYDVDFLSTLDKKFHATLSDYSTLNVEKGTALIEQRGLNKQVKFVQGDAFNTQYVKKLTKHANLVTVSGLYELYPDNSLIEASLSGISQGIASGGYLVYTNQPWHPQLKFIAKVLSSHREGQPWIMRRRTQQEMDQLVEKQGFEKIHQYIDTYGIFTVSIAQKK